MKGRYKMVEAVETMDGWYSLHDLRTMDWTSWKLTTSEARQEAITEFENLLDEWDAVEEREEGSHVMYNVIGQKAEDRKSTRLNSSHVATSYAVFCFKRKKLP